MMCGRDKFNDGIAAQGSGRGIFSAVEGVQGENQRTAERIGHLQGSEETVRKDPGV